MKLKNKIAVITGAGKGIGKATSELFVKEGAIVIGISRTESDLKKIKRKTKNFKGKFIPFIADITDEENVEKIFDYVERNFKKLDILINSAGVAPGGSIFDMEPEKFLYCLKLNIWSVFLCTQKAIRIMKKNKSGKIINVGSVRSHWTESGSAGAYNASKYGLKGFTESVARELHGSRLNISIGMVCPGVVNTPLTNPDRKPKLEWLKPETVAEAILFAVTSPENVNVYDIVIFPTFQKPW